MVGSSNAPSESRMKPRFSSGVFSGASVSAAASGASASCRIRASDADSTMIGASGGGRGAAAGGRFGLRPRIRSTSGAKRSTAATSATIAAIAARSSSTSFGHAAGQRRRGSLRSPAARAPRGAASGLRLRLARPPRADRLDDRDLLLLGLRLRLLLARWRSPASSFSGKAARAVRQAAFAPATIPRRAWRGGPGDAPRSPPRG